VWDAAVRGIDDERGAAVCRQLVAALVPEVVIGEHAALRLRRIAGARLTLLGSEKIAVQATVLGLLELGGLFRREDSLARELVGPLQRRNRRERERALKIWLPVCCPRRCPLA